MNRKSRIETVRFLSSPKIPDEPESRADFIHKLGIASKEARESRYWLKVIHRSAMIPPKRLESLMIECDELCAILAASISTARRKAASENRVTE